MQNVQRHHTWGAAQYAQASSDWNEYFSNLHSLFPYSAVLVYRCLSPSLCCSTLFLKSSVVVTVLLILVHSVRLSFTTPSPSIPCSAASPPLCPTLTDATADSLVVSWYPPNIPRGDITDYEVTRGVGILSRICHLSTTYIALLSCTTFILQTFMNVCFVTAAHHGMWVFLPALGATCVQILSCLPQTNS